ncbi:MAG: YegS/Rv2252/BmrU family lipid kinase [Bacteroidetes bacterium]|nr:YegS/Rv2252/BmrU family lipid kinase [Bacteroidota bacterium]
MGNKKKIRFIANPLSGARYRRRNLPALIADNLDPDQFDYELCFTQYAGHAVELAKEGVQNGCHLVVACGGDGSVNEISSQLIGTDTVLGVLPCGSGNGFAMHLGLGRNVARAIRHLNNGRPVTVDSCTANGRHFVNLAGVGFDAVVAKRLHDSRVRGFWAYLRYALEETWAYQMQSFDIQVDDLKFSRQCLLVEVANAPIYGYGFSIVPHAKLNDSLLEVLVVKAAPKWRYLLESWRFLNRSFHRSRLVECYTGRTVAITPARPTCIHLDGEGFPLDGEARFTIQPVSLKVLVPKAFAEILG